MKVAQQWRTTGQRKKVKASKRGLKMKRCMHKIYNVLMIAICFLASSAFADDYSSFGGAYSSFGAAQTCGISKCDTKACELKDKMVDDKLPNECPSGKRYDVDPNCVMNHNASSASCIDTMPLASIVRVSETNCYRPNGAGGNSTPRNHYGTDYAATLGTVVTAAADGVVKQRRWANKGGRSVVIEHDRVCQCGIGSGQQAPGSENPCEGKYTTVYYHLSAWAEGIEVGTRVKKGDPIGAVGGSNSISGDNCDSPTPKSDSRPCYSYPIHLHFEIHHGAYGDGTKLKSSMVNPLCDDIQTLCGRCQDNINECLDKTDPSQWTTLSDEAAQSKSVIKTSFVNTVFDTVSAAGFQECGRCALCNYKPDPDTCYFCGIFRKLFNVASGMALHAYQMLADGIAVAVLMFFALWVAMFMLKNVSNLEAQKPSKMLQAVLVQAFKVLIAVVILKTSYFYILKMTIEPVFNTGMYYTQAVSNAVKCDGQEPFLQGIAGFETADAADANGGLPRSMGRNILCSLKAMQDAVHGVIEYGKSLRCLGWEMAWLLGLIPNFTLLITGDFLIIAGFVFMFAFPWCLVDCILNMAVAAALIPVAIGAWPFKATRQYLKKIWDFFMNAMLQFVFMALIIYIIMTMVESVFANITDTFKKGFALEDGTWGSSIEGLLNVVTLGNGAVVARAIDRVHTDVKNLTDNLNYLKGNVLHPVEGIPFWSVNFLKLVLYSLLGWVFIKQAKDIAGKFAQGGPIEGMGSTVGSLYADTAKKAGKWVLDVGTSPVRKVASVALGGKGLAGPMALGGAAAVVAGHTISIRMANGKTVTPIKGGKFRQHEDGSSSVTGKDYRGREHTIIAYADGSFAQVHEQKDGTTVQYQYNAKGQLVKQIKTDKKGNSRNTMYNSDGSISGYSQEHRNKDGSVTGEAYDASGNRVHSWSEDTFGNKHAADYNSDGSLLHETSTDSKGNTAQRNYNADGSFVEKSYDSKGNPITK